MEVFAYSKTKEILNQKFLEKKSRNSSFSIRAWAMQMGFNSHGSLQQILAGKRTVPKKYIPTIVNSLGLTRDEAIYFETLVDYEKAKSEQQKEIYRKRLKNLKPNEDIIHMFEFENYKYFENPLHSHIRTMIERSDFINDPDWIKQQLRNDTNVEEINNVISRLKKLGFITEKNGKLYKTYKHVKNKTDIPSDAVVKYHQTMSMQAAEAVFNQDLETREFNSFCMNIKENKINDAKKKIRNFIKEFIDEFEAENLTSKETYQLNLQLFSLTNNTGEQ